MVAIPRLPIFVLAIHAPPLAIAYGGDGFDEHSKLDLQVALTIG
jgi:hypothetical protein